MNRGRAALVMLVGAFVLACGGAHRTSSSNDSGSDLFLAHDLDLRQPVRPTIPCEHMEIEIENYQLFDYRNRDHTWAERWRRRGNMWHRWFPETSQVCYFDERTACQICVTDDGVRSTADPPVLPERWRPYGTPLPATPAPLCRKSEGC